MPDRTDTVGGPARLATLLWTPTTRVGPTRLTVGSVTAAAVGIADAEGLAAVTMRRLAGTAGTGTMTLYRYVPGRAELLALMVDRVAGQVYDGRSAPGSHATAAAALGAVVDANWDHLLRHRWVVDVPPGRPVVGPGELGKQELELAAVDGRGLDDRAMDAVVGAVLDLVAAAARRRIGLDDALAAGAPSDEGRWRTAPQASTDVRDAFPLAARVGGVRDAGDPRRILDHGLAALVAALPERGGATR